MSNKEYALITIVIIVVLGASFLLLKNFVFNPSETAITPGTGSAPEEPLTTKDSIQGVIFDLASSVKVITLQIGEEGTVSLTVLPQTKFFDESGGVVAFSSLKRGFTISAKGKLISKDSFLAAEVKITKVPNIIVFSPAPNEEISSPLTIKGEARVFESTFAYRLYDGDAGLLFEGHAMAASPDAGLFGQFEVIRTYPLPKSQGGTLEVFEYSAKDGSEINKVVVPVKFARADTMKINAFFSNKIYDPNASDCAKVYPVTRTIKQTQAVARVALEELLRGPTASEVSDGFLTNIPKGVIIQSLTIGDGILRVDFNEALEFQVGGSCRLTAIRSQIRETVKQFPSVRDVVISINGRTEDILQP
ncbi:MAG: GerMN domain-containing protein [Candidatus Liptonbacteria bacterium]|nr:GerMN domain-containing protein [Candidatus Liptonbacteria bacterium]